MKPLRLFLVLAALATLPSPAGAESPAALEPVRIPAVAVSKLPPEVRDTLKLIQRGGPFPHRWDGMVFSNRERLLPPKPRGYYREYTVRTPGARDRGARRIVSGKEREYYYTDDHYRSFRRVRE